MYGDKGVLTVKRVLKHLVTLGEGLEKGKIYIICDKPNTLRRDLYLSKFFVFFSLSFGDVSIGIIEAIEWEEGHFGLVVCYFFLFHNKLGNFWILIGNIPSGNKPWTLVMYHPKCINFILGFFNFKFVIFYVFYFSILIIVLTTNN